MNVKSLQDPHFKLAAGRAKAVDIFPYFADALMGLVPRVHEGLGTFGVTKNMIMLWDPEVVKGWEIEEIAAVLVHEVSHVLRGHLVRGKALGADPRVFNIAGDMEINDDLDAAGLKLPKLPIPGKPGEFGDVIYPSTYGMENGQTAEFYYNELRNQAEKMAQQCNGKGCENQDGEGGQCDGQGSCSDEAPQVGGGWCGSCAGRAIPGEPDEAEASQEGRTQVEMEAVKRSVAEKIQEAAQKGIGNIPGNWMRWADEQLKPSEIPWRTKLSRLARIGVSTTAGMSDFTYARPSRRQSALGWGPKNPILPSLHAPRPELYVACDTSGSMGTDELTTAVSETLAILKAVNAEVTFMSNDAAIGEIKKVKTLNDIKSSLTGGGGTDLGEPLRYIENLPPRKRPSVFVFISDGVGPTVATPPKGVKTIWVLVGPHAQVPYVEGTNKAIEWGEHIFMKG